MTAPTRPVRFSPRVTVACVIEDQGRFLFVEEWVDGVLRLNQPAGHLEPDETLIEGAIRETLEETAWDVRLTGWLGIWQYPGRTDSILRVCFAGHPVREHDRPLDTGIVRALWLTPEELARHPTPRRTPMVDDCVHAWTQGALLPLGSLCLHVR